MLGWCIWNEATAKKDAVGATRSGTTSLMSRRRHSEIDDNGGVRSSDERVKHPMRAHSRWVLRLGCRGIRRDQRAALYMGLH